MNPWVILNLNFLSKYYFHTKHHASFVKNRNDILSSKKLWTLVPIILSMIISFYSITDFAHSNLSVRSDFFPWNNKQFPLRPILFLVVDIFFVYDTYRLLLIRFKVLHLSIIIISKLKRWLVRKNYLFWTW